MFTRRKRSSSTHKINSGEKIYSSPDSLFSREGSPRKSNSSIEPISSPRSYESDSSKYDLYKAYKSNKNKNKSVRNIDKMAKQDILKEYKESKYDIFFKNFDKIKTDKDKLHTLSLKVKKDSEKVIELFEKKKKEIERLNNLANSYQEELSKFIIKVDSGKAQKEYSNKEIQDRIKQLNTLIDDLRRKAYEIEDDLKENNSTKIKNAFKFLENYKIYEQNEKKNEKKKNKKWYQLWGGKTRRLKNKKRKTRKL